MDKQSEVRKLATQVVLGISSGLATAGGFWVFIAPEHLYRDYPALPPSARYGPGMEALLYWS